jgi:hypothetical protein
MKEGLAKSDSRRGVWKISEARYQYLAEHENSYYTNLKKECDRWVGAQQCCALTNN